MGIPIAQMPDWRAWKEAESGDFFGSFLKGATSGALRAAKLRREMGESEREFKLKTGKQKLETEKFKAGERESLYKRGREKKEFGLKEEKFAETKRHNTEMESIQRGAKAFSQNISTTYKDLALGRASADEAERRERKLKEEAQDLARQIDNEAVLMEDPTKVKAFYKKMKAKYPKAFKYMRPYFNIPKPKTTKADPWAALLDDAKDGATPNAFQPMIDATTKGFTDSMQQQPVQPKSPAQQVEFTEMLTALEKKFATKPGALSALKTMSLEEITKLYNQNF